MKNEFDYRKYFEKQLETLKEQEKSLEEKLSQNKANLNNAIKDKMEQLREKQKDYEQRINLAQIQGKDALKDTKKTLDKIWSDVKEGYEKVKEDIS